MSWVAGNSHPKLLQPPLQAGLANLAMHLLQHPLQELPTFNTNEVVTFNTSPQIKVKHIESDWPGEKPQRGLVRIRKKISQRWNVLTSIHQRGKNLIRQASQPLMINLRAFLLRLSLLQEPVTVLIDGLHDISKNHWAFHSRRDFCTTMQNTMIVHHHHGMLWPIKLALESVLLQQSHPSLVSIHVRFIDLKWKSRDTTFCLRLNHLGQVAIFIKAQNRMSMCQLKGVASRVGLSIVSTILGINTVSDGVRHIDFG